VTAGAGGPGWEAAHHYGPRVHVLENAWLASALARIGSPAVRRAELLALLRSAYNVLALSACGRELPVVGAEIPSRMAELHEGAGVFRGTVLDPRTSVVVVVRGGIVPSQVTYELLSAVLPESSVRLDHLSMQRTTDAQGRVTGVDLSGSKVGGRVDGATLIVPDPMGATGATLTRLVQHYRRHHGEPRRVIALPMIVTPEFLRAVLPRFDELVVYTGRVDRGLSDPDVLASEPGAHWDRERGLDERGYVVPGAGGVGEVLNNAWC